MGTLPRMMGGSGSGAVASRGSKRKGVCARSNTKVVPAKDNAKDAWVWLPRMPLHKQILVSLMIVFVLFLPMSTCIRGW